MKTGDVVFIGPDCSVQFTGDRALIMRLRSIGEVDPYNGWVWVAGYVLDARGLATAKRELYVIRAGLRVASTTEAVSNPGRKERVRVSCVLPRQPSTVTAPASSSWPP